jgi:hypothetical protein
MERRHRDHNELWPRKSRQQKSPRAGGYRLAYEPERAGTDDGS